MCQVGAALLFIELISGTTGKFGHGYDVELTTVCLPNIEVCREIEESLQSSRRRWRTIVLQEGNDRARENIQEDYLARKTTCIPVFER